MKDNTIATAGDQEYFWGILMLIASMRRNGMDEPVLVGERGFAPWQRAALERIPDVALRSLDGSGQSLTCAKPEVMLQADTEYVTWVDGDGFFIGNCSELLIPRDDRQIHIRRRSPEENPLAFRHFSYGEDGRAIPQAILDAWREDVGSGIPPRLRQSCSACLLSVHRSARNFLRHWRDQMAAVLPAGNVGVVDRRLKFYHQLDESVLNSLLCFAPEAPEPSPEYRLDRAPSRLFVHFIGQPKPWQGWTPRAIRFFHEYAAGADYAIRQGWINAGQLPAPLDPSRYAVCRLTAPLVSIRTKIRNRLRRLWS